MKLAYEMENGGVAIVQAAPKEALASLVGRRDEHGVMRLSDADYLAHVLERNRLVADDVVILPEDWQPPAAPRNSWRWSGGADFGVDAEIADAETIKTFEAAIQSAVDATARTRGYASGVALAGYASSTVPEWAAEAATFIAWRDQIWLYAYRELAKVQSGQRQKPKVSEIVAGMPAIEWPK